MNTNELMLAYPNVTGWSEAPFSGRETAEAQRGTFTVRIFDSFKYLSHEVPSKHAELLRSVANEIVDHKVVTVILIGHALGSTIERKYTLGFRRALSVSVALLNLINRRQAELARFPRLLVASFGDTFPLMGTNDAKDRRVDVIFRRGP